VERPVTVTRKVTPVILSGGSGSRLWPLSRLRRPKQLLPLTGDRSLLQATALRVCDSSLFERPLVVGSARDRGQISQQLRDVLPDGFRLILEPVARNTAPAVLLAALAAQADDLLLIVPSDHVMDAAAFRAAVASAKPLAEEGAFILFGVTASAPNPGYGYILPGSFTGGAAAVRQFLEKPSATEAATLIAAGSLWNSGIVLCRAEVLIEGMKSHAPELYAAVEAAIRGRTAGEEIAPRAGPMRRAPFISLDYALLQKTERLKVVPVDLHWSDVGSWDALYEVSRELGGAVAILGPVATLDTRGCLVHSYGPVVGTIDVEDLLIVATPTAVLVARRGSSERVKELLERLEKLAASDRIRR
jgi:mannose-1-phosphate guanylyltransferase